MSWYESTGSNLPEPTTRKRRSHAAKRPGTPVNNAFTFGERIEELHNVTIDQVDPFARYYPTENLYPSTPPYEQSNLREAFNPHSDQTHANHTSVPASFVKQQPLPPPPTFPKSNNIESPWKKARSYSHKSSRLPIESEVSNKTVSLKREIERAEPNTVTNPKELDSPSEETPLTEISLEDETHVKAPATRGSFSEEYIVIPNATIETLEGACFLSGIEADGFMVVDISRN